MKEVAVIVYDDLDIAADGTKVRADVTVSLGYHGNWYELDLTEEHAKELRELIQPYLQAGRKPDFRPRSPAGGAPRKGGSGIIARSWEHGRPWGKAIREFMRETEGIELGTYIGRGPRDKFAKYLASLPEQDRPYFYTPGE